MSRIKFIVGAILFVLVLSTSWQIASCELTNLEFKDDLKDVAAMGGGRIGMLNAASDDDLRDEVVERAAEHHIRLVRDQVFIQRSGTPENPKVFLAARYQSRVTMPGLSMIFHFTATSR